MSEQEQSHDTQAMAQDMAPEKKRRKIFNRRNFLIGSAVVAGGVAFGGYWLARPYANPLLDDLADGEAAFTPYLKIDQDGIVAITGRAEMGQGANSVLVAMLADELDVDYEDIRVEHGPADKAYYVGSAARSLATTPNHLRDEKAVESEYGMRWIAKLLGFQITGGSMTTDDGYYVMRRTGAAAREALTEAAARQWGVSAAQLSTDNGHVVNPANGARLSYIALAVAAAGIPLNDEPKLKDPAEYKYIGKSTPRNDMIPKVTGTAQFGMDIQLDGMVYAAVRENPYRWRPIKRLDASAALNRRGVKQVVQLEQGYAVIADNSWRAMQALDDVEVEWDTQVEYPGDMDAVYADLANIMENGDADGVTTDIGDADSALAAAENVHKGEYRVPYLAHMQMEPMNATVLYTDDGIEIWTGTQSPTPVVSGVAKVTGMAKDKIKLNTVFLGGGFGRRGEIDYAQTAALVAREIKGTPVKVLWSREDDFNRDTYRPAALARLEGVVENGKVTALKGQASTLSVVNDNFGKRVGLPVSGPDTSITEGMSHQPYDIRNYHVVGYRSASKMPVGAWRSVGASQNAFFLESFLDELAAENNLDPLAMRLDLAAPYAPVRKLLEKVGEMSNWGSKLGPNRARGIAMCSSFYTFVAEVVEISQTGDGITVDKMYIAADPGTVIDRHNFEAQMTGGAIFGLSQAMMGAATVSGGTIDQSNFHDFQIPNFTQTPQFDVAILENHVGVGGAGEPATPPAGPALGNAIFALTGKRLREMPFNKFVDFA